VTRVAVLGLGRMGAPMAGRLAAAGHTLTVFNRTPRPAAVPAGATAAPTPGAAAADAAVIVTMVADGAALDALLDGDDGVLRAAPRGAVVVDMSTIGPLAARAAAGRCAVAGVRFLDAPVSGSVAAARSGDLVAMVGGEAAVLEAARPVLRELTREQIHVGPSGAGAAMKLALNLALAVSNQSIAETLVLAERSGVARALAYDVLAAGALASPFVGYKRAAFEAPGETPVAFSVELMRKDVDLALALAAAAGLDLPAGRSAAQGLALAVSRGLGHADIASVVRAVEAVDPGPEEG
jgi:3-hydroxyisobutyrate dehydrogenase/2-hydroxy-3-oxopropionate reductase